MGKTCRLDHRADVVEHDRLDLGRAHHRQHMDDQPAARRPDKGCFSDAKGVEAGDDVGRFHADIVVLPVRVIGRPSPAAIVEAYDSARVFDVVGKMQCQLVKVPGVAGQARQADDRAVAAASGIFVTSLGAIESCVQPEPVLRGVVEVRKALRIGHQAASPLPTRPRVGPT